MKWSNEFNLIKIVSANQTVNLKLLQIEINLIIISRFINSQVTVDALVLSGTNPSLMIVRDMILKGRISGEQAVQVMSLFVGAIETPTKELLSSFIVSYLFLLKSISIER